jgi:Gpi18-like mannosyltransferase
LVSVLAIAELWYIATHGAHAFDYNCFKTWATHIYQHGLTNTYTIWNDYMPFYQYALFAFGKIAGSEAAIVKYVFYLKLFTLVFDYAALYYIYKWLDKRIDYFLILLVSMLNIGFGYNTIIWGQVDGILSCLVLMSVYYAWKNNLIISMLCYVLALNMKLQALMYLPVVGLLYLLSPNFKLKEIVKGIVMVLLVQALILLPFALNKEGGLSLLWAQVQSAFHRYPTLGENNFWSFVRPADSMQVSDAGIWFAGLTYKQIGLLLFVGSSFFAILPLLKALYKKWIKKEEVILDKQVLWVVCSLVALLFYYFPTEMHERYSHPALFFLTAYAFYSKDYIVYALYSLAYFLVMEDSMRGLPVNHDTLFLFHPFFIAGLFGVVMLYLYWRLYTPKSYFRRYSYKTNNS